MLKKKSAGAPASTSSPQGAGPAGPRPSRGLINKRRGPPYTRW